MLIDTEFLSKKIAKILESKGLGDYVIVLDSDRSIRLIVNVGLFTSFYLLKEYKVLWKAESLLTSFGNLTNSLKIYLEDNKDVIYKAILKDMLG